MDLSLSLSRDIMIIGGFCRDRLHVSFVQNVKHVLPVRRFPSNDSKVRQSSELNSLYNSTLLNTGVIFNYNLISDFISSRDRCDYVMVGTKDNLIQFNPCRENLRHKLSLALHSV